MKLCVVLLLVAVAAQPVKRKHKIIRCAVPYAGTSEICIKQGATTLYFYNTETEDCTFEFSGCEPDTPLQGTDCYYACNVTEEIVP